MNTNDTRGPGNHPLASLSDAELVERYKRGNLEAFTVLHQRHAARIRGYLRGLYRCPSTADDLLQEVWIRFNSALRSETVKRGGVRALLFHIARLVSTDHLRKKCSQKEAPFRLSAEAYTSMQPAMADPDRLEAQELLEWIEGQLDGRERALLNGLIEGMTRQDIAEDLQLSSNATGLRIHRLRLKVRLLLEERKRK